MSIHTWRSACQPLMAALLCAVMSFALLGQVSAQAGGDKASGAGGWHERLEVAVGEQKVIDADGVRSFSEGTKGIIDIRLTKDNDRFVIVGVRPGNTTLLFIMMDGSQVHYDVVCTDPNATPTLSKDAVPVRDNIRLDFYFVQLSNTYSHNLGVGWPTSLAGNAGLSTALDLQTGAFSAASISISTSVLPRLDFAQADGWAKIMRKAAVITANGMQANFTGGNEINLAISGGFGGTLKQISYGSTIGVRPRYDKERPDRTRVECRRVGSRVRQRHRHSGSHARDLADVGQPRARAVDHARGSDRSQRERESLGLTRLESDPDPGRLVRPPHRDQQ